MKYLENFIRMKKILLIILGIPLFVSSCDSKNFEEKEELPRVDGREKIVVIDDCEYIEYQSTFYCGHQYDHHEYKASLLTHKGNCKNHK